MSPLLNTQTTSHLQLLITTLPGWKSKLWFELDERLSRLIGKHKITMTCNGNHDPDLGQSRKMWRG